MSERALEAQGTMVTEQTIAINSNRDIVMARNTGREMARTLGFSSTDQTRLATAISELTRNVCQYAGSGVCIITDTSGPDMVRLRVVVEDQGPGIADLAAAQTAGFSTGGGLGLGLPGAERLVDTFEIDSAPGHTRIVMSISRVNRDT